jgi:hypothetical protein
MIFSLIFQECKKGPDDPEISFRSRKTRMTGEWHLSTGNAGLTLLDPTASPYAQGFVLDGTHAKATETPAGGTPIVYSFVFLLSLDVKKDGTFTLVETYGNKVLNAKGKWNFLSGIGEAKNKEYVNFVIETVDGDETVGHLFNKQSTEFNYRIRGLRNKDLKLESGTKEYLNANGKSISYSGSYEFTQ